MDFVEGLGDGPDVLEIPVDGIGRIEIQRGRVRVTYTRMIERGDVTREVPCLTLVWSAEAWLLAFGRANESHRTIHAHAANAIKAAMPLRHH